MTEKHIQITHEYSLIEDIFQAYYDARKNKRNSNSSLGFELEYEKNLVQLFHEINERSYKPRPYSAFIIEKPVKREVFASEFRDRVVHHLIFNYINPIFDPLFINDSYSCRVNKGTSYGIKRADYFIKSCSQNYKKDAYIMKLDVEGYFMSIDKTILFEIIKTQIIKRQDKLICELDLILFLVEKVIFCDPTKDCIIKSGRESWQGLPKSKSLFFSGKNKGLPIGNLTSQLFANIYLNEIDQFIKRELKFKYYGRYVDDMIFVDNDKERLIWAIKEIKKYLASNLSLKLHPKKIYLQNSNKGVNFLGAFIKPYRILVGKRIKSNLYRKVYEGLYILNYSNAKISDFDKNFEFKQLINSYFGILKQANSYTFRKGVVELIVDISRGDFVPNDDFSVISLCKKYTVLKV
ncbi:MAG: RNA-directed DNA polymerase [Candidatus Saccharibacteria bacterium]